MLRLTCICILITYVLSSYVRKAIVKIDGDAGVTGSVNFTQRGNQVIVEGTVHGLTPGLHGFHIHEFGNIFTNGCYSTGGHFNPYHVNHGGLHSRERHVGDFGNIEAGPAGIAVFRFTDTRVSFFGKTNIVGRAAVIHSGVDDLGLGSNNASRINGNSGNRIGCGVIGILKESCS